MSPRCRWIVPLGLCVLAGCGAGGGGSGASGGPLGACAVAADCAAPAVSPAVSPASGGNTITITVGPRPAAGNGGTFNILTTSVTLCNPGTTTCATINDVLVDTGSYGLRIMASALQSAGLSLTNMVDPANASNTIAECLPFADGYTWGPVATADARMAGELASSVSVNIIDDNASYAASAPTSCQHMSSGTSLSSVAALDANGVLGVGLYIQDCGTSCADCASFSGGCSGSNDLYYSCNTGTNTCSFTPMALASQVQNPVALFATDNNGVLLQLPSVPAAGQTQATGSLIFGIATQSDNALGSATVITVNAAGAFTTTFDSQTLTGSFIDSGSNALFFPDSSITICTNTPGNSGASDFYCPSSPQLLSATNLGQNGASSSVQFEITSLNSLNDSYYAAPTLGGPAPKSPTLGRYFDWGLPFFYGRSVFTAIDGMTAGSAVGPYFAY